VGPQYLWLAHLCPTNSGCPSWIPANSGYPTWGPTIPGYPTWGPMNSGYPMHHEYILRDPRPKCPVPQEYIPAHMYIHIYLHIFPRGPCPNAPRTRNISFVARAPNAPCPRNIYLLTCTHTYLYIDIPLRGPCPKCPMPQEYIHAYMYIHTYTYICTSL
jgi:hypothetical protein